MSSRLSSESTAATRSMRNTPAAASKKSNSPYAKQMSQKEESPYIRRNRVAREKKMELEGNVYRQAITGKGEMFGEFFEIQRELQKMSSTDSDGKKHTALTPENMKAAMENSLGARLLSGSGSMKMKQPNLSMNSQSSQESPTPARATPQRRTSTSPTVSTPLSRRADLPIDTPSTPDYQGRAQGRRITSPVVMKASLSERKVRAPVATHTPRKVVKPTFPCEEQWPDMMATETLDAIWQHALGEYRSKIA